jgi:hypothetical protein
MIRIVSKSIDLITVGPRTQHYSGTPNTTPEAFVKQAFGAVMATSVFQHHETPRLPKPGQISIQRQLILRVPPAIKASIVSDGKSFASGLTDPEIVIPDSALVTAGYFRQWPV